MVFSKEQSLMTRLNLNIDQLDYKFIENCKDVKNLEKILKVLRSGEEGIFPDLIKFCEEKLSKEDPNNRLLKKENIIKRYIDLPEEERRRIQDDIKKWSIEKSQFNDEKSAKCIHKNNNEIPPIRNQREIKQSIQEAERTAETNENKLKCNKPRSYKEWDKFNVEEELKKLEIQETPEEDREKLTNTTIQLCDSINTNGFTQENREYIAELENTKGNEAYKAQEYEEAVVYYTRSLSVCRMTKSLNNRAQAYIKIKNYIAAIADCNEVLNIDPNDIKAFYRRGLAQKEAGMLELAMIDFRIVLEIDSECQAAKDQLLLIRSLMFRKETPNVLIEELESSVDEKEKTDDSVSPNDSSVKIQIEEVAERPKKEKWLLLDELCNFNEDSTLPLSKKLKDMLTIQNDNPETKYLKKKINNQKVFKSADNKSERNEKLRTHVEEIIDEAENNASTTRTKSDFFDIKIHDGEKTNKNTSGDCNKSDALTKNKKVTYENQVNKELVKGDDLNNDNKRSNEFLPEENLLVDSKRILTDEKEISTVEAVMTPFEFITVWSSSNAYRNSKAGANILCTMKPHQLPLILTNKLDGQVLIGLLRAIAELINTGKIEDSFQYLRYLVQTPRVNIVSMLLTEKERNDIRHLFFIMDREYKIDTAKIKEILRI